MKFEDARPSHRLGVTHSVSYKLYYKEMELLKLKMQYFTCLLYNSYQLIYNKICYLQGKRLVVCEVDKKKPP